MKKLLKNMKENEKGFTLIELIVVIAIIGILAAVLLPKFGGFTDSARKKAVLSEAKNVYTAYAAAQAESGFSTDADAVTAVTKNLGKLPKDTTGKADIIDFVKATPITEDTIPSVAIVYSTGINGKVYKVVITDGGGIYIKGPAATDTLMLQ